MKAMGKAKRGAAPAMKAMKAKRVAAAAPAMKAMKAKRVAAPAMKAMKAKKVAAAAPAMKAMKAKRVAVAATAMKAMKAKKVAAAPAMKAMKAKRVAAVPAMKAMKAYVVGRCASGGCIVHAWQAVSFLVIGRRCSLGAAGPDHPSWEGALRRYRLLISDSAYLLSGKQEGLAVAAHLRSGLLRRGDDAHRGPALRHG